MFLRNRNVDAIVFNGTTNRVSKIVEDLQAKIIDFKSL